MAQLRLEPPAPFNFRTPDDWPRWRQRFEQFRVASGLSGDKAVKQVNTLLYCIGEEAEGVLTSTNTTDEERKVYETVLDKFDSFFKVRRNVIFERARFNRRNQHEDETAEKYIMELYGLAESCDYGALRDEMICDRLVVGIRDAALSQQLQLDAALTLEKAKKRIRQKEAVGEQHNELKSSAEGPSSLEEIRFRRKPKRWQHPHKARELRPKTTPTKKACTRCGKEPHPREKCLAKDAVCHRCNKKGHYSSQCFAKRVSEISSENVLDTAFLDTVSAKQASAWFTTIKLNEQETSFKLDTGAEVTAISEQTYKSLKEPQLLDPEKVLYGPSRQPLKTLGQFWGSLSYRGKEAKQCVFVVDGLKTNLLGLPAITALGLAVRIDTTDTDAPTTTLADIMKQFPSVFQGLGNLGEEYEIHLKPGATPHSLYAPRNVPLPLRSKVKE